MAVVMELAQKEFNEGENTPDNLDESSLTPDRRCHAEEWLRQTCDLVWDQNF